ncbi:MAG: hypothetical protein WCS20_09910 [Alphaproteobacteria bacterium]|jgi:hypothetical protein
MILRRTGARDAQGMAAMLIEITATDGTTAHRVPKPAGIVQLDDIDGP